MSSRRRQNDLSLGFWLLIGGFVMVVGSSAFSGLGLPGLSDVMGLLAFIGFGLAVGGVLILLAPFVMTLSKAFLNGSEGRSRKSGSYAMARSLEAKFRGHFQPSVTPPWDLQMVRSLDWKVFEELCMEYLRETGFRAEQTPLGGDGGVDIWVSSMKDDRRVAAVQCKAWNTWQVRVKPVRELYGVMAAEGIPHGMFVTTGVFTGEAEAFAEGKTLKLIDGAAFLSKIQALPEETQNRLMQKITTGDYTTPSCPKCGRKLIKRSSTRGNFWGCPAFPRCRGKLNAIKSVD